MKIIMLNVYMNIINTKDRVVQINYCFYEEVRKLFKTYTSKHP